MLASDCHADQWTDGDIGRWPWTGGGNIRTVAKTHYAHDQSTPHPQPASRAEYERFCREHAQYIQDQRAPAPPAPAAPAAHAPVPPAAPALPPASSVGVPLPPAPAAPSEAKGNQVQDSQVQNGGDIQDSADSNSAGGAGGDNSARVGNGHSQQDNASELQRLQAAYDHLQQLRTAEQQTLAAEQGRRQALERVVDSLQQQLQQAQQRHQGRVPQETALQLERRQHDLDAREKQLERRQHDLDAREKQLRADRLAFTDEKKEWTAQSQAQHESHAAAPYFPASSSSSTSPAAAQTARPASSAPPPTAPHSSVGPSARASSVSGGRLASAVTSALAPRTPPTGSRADGAHHPRCRFDSPPTPASPRPTQDAYRTPSPMAVPVPRKTRGVRAAVNAALDYHASAGTGTIPSPDVRLAPLQAHSHSAATPSTSASPPAAPAMPVALQQPSSRGASSSREADEVVPVPRARTAPGISAALDRVFAHQSPSGRIPSPGELRRKRARQQAEDPQHHQPMTDDTDFDDFDGGDAAAPHRDAKRRRAH